MNNDVLFGLGDKPAPFTSVLQYSVPFDTIRPKMAYLRYPHEDGYQRDDYGMPAR